MMCFVGTRGGSWWTYNFQLALGDSADAVGPKVGVTSLDATQATEVLVALLLPLGDQVLVCVAFFYAVIIQLCGQRDENKNTLNCQIYTSQNRQPKNHIYSTVSKKKCTLKSTYCTT